MKDKEVHILNGDALKMQFPKSISGELIIMRECLVDGDVSGSSLKDLLKVRVEFFRKAYKISEEDYRNGIEPEINKIKSIQNDATVNLWFEDDLFCQVHLWFSCHLLFNFTKVKHFCLIRPTADIRYGFGGMNTNELEKAFQNRRSIDERSLELFHNLWMLYQQKKHEKMLDLAEEKHNGYPFLLPAIQANMARFPVDGSLGRPQRTLLTIIDELKTDDFGMIFKAFHEREAIYGFGDAQVKRLLKQLNE